MSKVSFTQMKDGSKEEYELLSKFEQEFAKNLPDRILEVLKNLDDSLDGYQVSRFEHSLQSATRAEKDGADEEMVVATLLHDIGDTLASANHADLAATMLQPFISEKNYWIVKHHGIFQGYYFFDYVGLDKNLRDQFKDHEHWNDCAEFCAIYDQNSFDPEYENMTLEEFEPMVKSVFSSTRESIYKRGDYN